MHPKDADGMANSVDPDQTASCSDLSVPIHRIFTVPCFFGYKTKAFSFKTQSQKI